MISHTLRAAFAGLMLFVVGVAVGVYAWEVNRQEAVQLEGWLAADGSVTSTFGSGSSSRALVSFRTSSGDRINFTARPGLGNRLSAGDTVNVRYPPFQPTSAIVDSRSARWTWNGIYAAAALVLMALGAYVAWTARQQDLRRS
jgi:Protein of unknown function (DUF3592)